MPEMTDDFDNLPMAEIGNGLELMPSEAELKAARFRELVEKAAPRAMSLGKGMAITQMVDQGHSLSEMAEETGLTRAEVKSVAETYQDLNPREKTELKKFETFSENSVFNLYARLEELFREITNDLKFLDDPEIKIAYYGEKRQLFKLAKDVLQDVTFKEREEAKRERHLQVIFKYLDRLPDRDLAEMQKELKLLQEREKLQG